MAGKETLLEVKENKIIQRMIKALNMASFAIGGSDL